MTASAGAVSAVARLRWQFRMAHGLVEAGVDGLSSEARSSYARRVLTEDVTVNGVLAARPPLALSTWSGRTGLSELPPLPGLTGRRTRACPPLAFELAAFRGYARAVYAATDAYLEALGPDCPELQRGHSTLCILSGLLLGVVFTYASTPDDLWRPAG